MTLKQWAEKQPYRVGTHSSGCKWIPDGSGLVDRSEAWHLEDYAVDSVIAGSVWFVRRQHARLDDYYTSPLMHRKD